jgi:hypothetical protein
MTTLLDIRNATLAARVTAPDIGTRVKQGTWQVIRVTPRASGHCDILPLTEWTDIGGALTYLKGITQ